MKVFKRKKETSNSSTIKKTIKTTGTSRIVIVTETIPFSPSSTLLSEKVLTPTTTTQNLGNNSNVHFLSQQAIYLVVGAGVILLFLFTCCACLCFWRRKNKFIYNKNKLTNRSIFYDEFDNVNSNVSTDSKLNEVLQDFNNKSEPIPPADKKTSNKLLTREDALKISSAFYETLGRKVK
ncbi:hypothetical protein HDU92_003226 [Lobulomyces angularis]|nr:hypothetical protein HDU92_003226 [Lobulomyces angularis]